LVLGVEYKKRSKELWKLRNALVHNAINVEAYLSSTEEPEQEGWAHLEMLIGGSGLIYINTRRAASDVLLAFRRVKEQVEKDKAIAQRASDRLAWADNTQQGVGKKEFTPPAPVQVVTLKDNCPVRRPRCC
jgi:hypothetical protein